MFRLPITLCTVTAALLLISCGGSSNDSSDSAGAAASIFPDHVLNGRLAVGLKGESLSIDIIFAERDFSSGGTYRGTVLVPAEDGENDDKAIEYQVTGTIRQTTQSIPGHVYLQFPGIQENALDGVLILELPSGGRQDDQHTRTGRVESSELNLTTAGGMRYAIDLQGKEVQITW